MNAEVIRKLLETVFSIEIRVVVAILTKKNLVSQILLGLKEILKAFLDVHVFLIGFKTIIIKGIFYIVPIPETTFPKIPDSSCLFSGISSESPRKSSQDRWIFLQV